MHGTGAVHPPYFPCFQDKRLLPLLFFKNALIIAAITKVLSYAAMFGYLITALIGCGVMFLSSGAYAQEASTTYDSIAPWRVDKPVYIQETGPLRPRLLREMHVEGPQGQVTVPSPLELFLQGADCR